MRGYVHMLPAVTILECAFYETCVEWEPLKQHTGETHHVLPLFCAHLCFSLFIVPPCCFIRQSGNSWQW